MSPGSSQPARATVFGVGSRARRGDRLSVAEARKLVHDEWGVAGQIRAFDGEVDQNFEVDAAQQRYVLKVLPADEAEAVTELITAALLHLEGARGILAPRVILTGAGAGLARFVDSNGAERLARMTTFIEGPTLRTTAPSAQLRRRLGETAAKLDAALSAFSHAGGERELSWDLRHAGRMGAMLKELAPSPGHAALAQCLESFDAITVPRLDPLPAQVIHNDVSRDNTVVSAGGALGVIDFGDMVRTQRVNELAIAMADHVESGEDPLGPALDVAAGYLEGSTLEPTELEVLYPLVRTRIATRIIGGEWRAARSPDQRRYLGRNVARQSEVFAVLPERPSDRDARRLAALAALAERGDVTR
jgi:hydroxylysine kinase